MDPGWASRYYSKRYTFISHSYVLSWMGPSNSRGKLFSVSVIAHGSPDQSCNSWSWCLLMAHRPGNVQYIWTLKLMQGWLCCLLFTNALVQVSSAASVRRRGGLFNVSKENLQYDVNEDAPHRSWWRPCVFLGHIVGKRNFLLTVPG